MNKLHISEGRLQACARSNYFRQLIDLNVLHLSHDGTYYYCSRTGAIAVGIKSVHDLRNRKFIFSLKFQYSYPGLT